jgi:hypothetical protein
MPRRQRVVTDPFVWVAPPPFSYSTGLPVPEVAGVPGRLQLLAFEGERGFGEETLVAGGVAIGGDNPFDSSIEGERTPAFDNNLGVDIDAYDLTIDAPTGNLLIEARSDDDGFRLAVIALTVDLET